MEEKKVKGTVLLDFIKIIKTHPHLDWNKYLTQQDWDVVNSIVLPAKWYPLMVFHRCAQGAFHLIGQGNLESARANGQILAKRMFETTYKSMAHNQDPMHGLNHFLSTFSSLFNFAILKMEKIGPRHARAQYDYTPASGDPDQQANIPFAHQLRGMLETLVQITGGKNHKVLLSNQNQCIMIFDITWE
jgi:hypothetical protein